VRSQRPDEVRNSTERITLGDRICGFGKLLARLILERLQCDRGLPGSLASRSLNSPSVWRKQAKNSVHLNVDFGEFSRRGHALDVSRVRSDFVGSAFCSVVGAFLCVLPHAIWQFRVGEPVWAADQDELYYLAVGARAFFEHPFWLEDPTRAHGQSVYQALPLLPGVWLARLLSLPPQWITLVWRCWGGGLAGLGYYWVSRQVGAKPGISIAAAIWSLTDVGMLEFKPLLRLAWVVWQVASGHPGLLFESNPMIFRHFRIATPCLTMPYLLLFIGLHVRARAFPTLRRQIVAGISFGLLFYVYFYFWTAAAIALVIAAVLDPPHRRLSLHSGAIGGLLAVPTLCLSMQTWASASADWLHRSDKFLHIPHFAELILPLPAVILLALTILAVKRYRRELILTWSAAAAGLGLMNHQVVTGLQIENFHWVYVAGPCLSLLVVQLLAGAIPSRNKPFFVWPALFLSGMCLIVGIWLRGIEATRTKEVIEILSVFRDYREQRLRDAGTARLKVDSVVAGDELAVDWAAILERAWPLANYWVMLGPSVTDEEWDLSIALNSYLLGNNRSAFVDEQTAILTAPGFRGPWGRDRSQLARRLESRLQCYNEIAADPEKYLTRAHLRYVWLKAGRTPPGDRGHWAQSQAGPFWVIWEYRSSP
jgi:hypothetical protein